MGCATDIPNIRAYREIPFSDGREGVYIETVTHKTGLVSAEGWAKMAPFMIMIDPDGWAAIKKNWYVECRSAKQCTVTVDSIDNLVKQLDSVAGAVLKP